jgi:hypothetical protein
MKTRYFIFIISSLLLLLFSCTKVKRLELVQEKQDCLPGYIWINYVGETNHIKRFTLIRTCEQDTSYLVSAQEDWNSWYNDKTFFDTYCNNYIVDVALFSRLKNYIQSHNTQKKEEMENMDGYTDVKVVLIDSCDSIGYIVNGKDAGYFSNMIDSVKPDSKLREYLKYYQRIQNRKIEY